MSITAKKAVSRKPKVALLKTVRKGASNAGRAPVKVTQPIAKPKMGANEERVVQDKALGVPGHSLGFKSAAAAKQLDAGALVARSKLPKFYTKRQEEKMEADKRRRTYAPRVAKPKAPKAVQAKKE